MALIPLPAQPVGTPWPTVDWPTGDVPPGVDHATLAAMLDHAFADPAPKVLGETEALLIVQGGRLVVERYGAGRGPADTCRSWSMAKSITHALAGLLVADGRLDIHAPADVPEWSAAGDPRGTITMDHLLRMSSGLAFIEAYSPEQPSDVIEMLFGKGAEDVAAFAAAFPLAHPPGSFFAYSSGTTNIIARCLARALGSDAGGAAPPPGRSLSSGRPSAGPGGPYSPRRGERTEPLSSPCGGSTREAGEGGPRHDDAFEAFMRERLFDPLGMTSAAPKFDAAGTFIGSSFCFATPRDFARFGLLYLRGGVWEGRPLLPATWIDYARTPTFQQADCPDGPYGAHWWLGLAGPDSFSANGYQGQYLILCPDRDLIIARNGVTAEENQPALKAWLAELAGLFS